MGAPTAATEHTVMAVSEVHTPSHMPAISAGAVAVIGPASPAPMTIEAGMAPTPGAGSSVAFATTKVAHTRARPRATTASRACRHRRTLLAGPGSNTS